MTDARCCRSRPIDLPAGRVVLRELPGPAGAPTIVLLHGLGVTADINFYRCYRSLGERFRVLAFDQRGHGDGDPHPRPFRLADCADDAVAMADVVGVDTFVPVGYSMGGADRPAGLEAPPATGSAASCCARRRRTSTARRSSRSTSSASAASPLLARLTPPARAPLRRRRATGVTARPTGRQWARDQTARSDWRAVLEAGAALGRFRSDPWISGSRRAGGRRRSRCTTRWCRSRRQRRLAALIPDVVVFPVDGDHDAVVAVPQFPATLVAAIDSVVAARRREAPRPSAAVAAAPVGVGDVAGHRRRRRRRPTGPVSHTSRRARNLQLARIGLDVGSTYAAASARKLFASAERRVEIDAERQLRTAEQVAERLGQMKGALMKIGQMASYLDDGLPEPVRQALAELQANAPPMSGDLAAEVITEELGAPPEKIFVEWDPAADRRGVDRPGPSGRDPRSGAPAGNGRSPSRCSTQASPTAIAADLQNTDLIGMFLRQTFSSLDPAELVAEIKQRLGEELDYRQERDNQQRFVDFYRGHPYFSVPEVIHPLCTARVLTTDLAAGATWRRGADVGPGRARPDRRGLVPLRVPQPLPHAGVQRRPASRQLPVPRRRADHVPRLRPRSLLQQRRDRRVRRAGEGGGRRPRRCRVPRSRRARRAAAARRARRHRRRRRVLLRLLRARRRGRADDVDEGVRQPDRAAHVRSHEPDRPVRHRAACVRVHPADQPRPLRPARRPRRDRQLPARRRGAVAVRRRPAVDADGRRPSRRGCGRADGSL